MSIEMSSQFDSATAFDANYSQRHERRNRRKIRRILSNVDAGEHVLDIGCNFGYISAALLRTGKSKRVDAVELNRSVVDPILLEDSRFNFHEGSATEYPFSRVCTGTIYCAVHHHIFGLYGKSQAFDTWRKIIDHSDRFVIFETGQLIEGEKYYWQRAMRAYYSSDERHLGDLLHAIGPRLKGVRVIDHLPIHGIKRALLKIELHPRGSSHDIAAAGPEAYGELLDDTSPWVAVKRYRRTIGSRSQALVDIEENPGDGPVKIYEGTTFSILRREDTGQEFFAKNTEDNPFKLLREHNILAQLDNPRIVKPVAVSSEFGLIFPYLDHVPLQTLPAKEIKDKDRLVAEILAFYQYARDAEVDLGLLDYRRYDRKEKRRLIDVVDLNLSNILVKLDQGVVRDWVFVDFESFGHDNRARNEKHLAGIMELLGHRKSDLIVKNPLQFVLKRLPYLSRFARRMNKIPFYAIVDSAPGRGRPEVAVLDSAWKHLLRTLAYSWFGKASIEESIFGDDAALRESRLTLRARKLRKKARRVVAKSPLGNWVH